MKLTSVASREEVYQNVVNVLHEMFELDRSRLTMDAKLFTDLDIDSIDAIDLVVKLNEITGKRIQPEMFKSVRTIEDIVNALHALLKEAAV